MSGVARSRSLPGVVFATPGQPIDDALPRMDVAGFVGYAERGPVDVPALVTDPRGFADVFGGPLALVLDATAGETAWANLSSAVAAFFAEGGRRCWVVRVTARQPHFPYASLAYRASIPLPGVGDGAGGQLLLAARSVGAWADKVRLTATLQRRPVRVDDVVIEDDGTVRCRLLSGALAVHDLVAVMDMLLFVVDAVSGDVVLGSRAVGTAPTVGTGTGGSFGSASGPALGSRVGEVRGHRGAVVLLDLEAHQPDGRRSVLTGLGCAPGHPRYVGDLPLDEDLAAEALESLPRPLTALRQEAVASGFPLAGALMSDGQDAASVVYPELPLWGDVRTSGPWRPAASGPEAEGLPSSAPSVFADPRLSGVGVRALPAVVEQIRDVQERPLLGLHALLAVDEVTLLALPDSVQRRWHQSVDAPTYVEADQESYVVDRTCAHDGPGLRDLPRAELQPPVLDRDKTAAVLTLTWDPVPHAVFVVEESTRPWTWEGAVEVYRGDADRVELVGRGPGSYRFRIRAESPEAASDWSASFPWDVPTAAPWTTSPVDEDELIALQLTTLTACAARGDLFAVLAAPAGARPSDAARLAEALRAAAGADQRLLSFGALYHPWTVPTSGPATSPDGAATGVLAATAATVGCWREAANVALLATVSLDPAPDASGAFVAAGAGTNLLLEEPRGRLTLSAWTLSRDPDLSRIAVRRLLSMLRRLAARHGTAAVFEPNDAVLRRHLRRQLEAVLDQLLRRGAFAGPGPQDSFQVRVTSPEESHLLVELKVAPAHAMRWLTVVLEGDRGRFTTSEVG